MSVKTVSLLALRRIKYNKSRTLLTMLAIMLTTTLLAGLVTGAMALWDSQKQQAAAETNRHAVFRNLTLEQADILKDHIDVEAVQLSEIFAPIDYDRMNGFLTAASETKGIITSGVGNLTEGRTAQRADEICGPPAFFERMNVEPVIGNTLTIAFRPYGKGEIVSRDFVICGLVTQNDVSKLGEINDSRIAYGATVSEELVNQFIPHEDRRVNASIRVNGEDTLNYNEICDLINDVAADIGCTETDIDINKGYLMAVTDPGAEMITIVAAAAIIIALFAGIVIYSIYYVGVITDVQEIGKLKALGASKRQIKGMLLREGVIACIISVPVGLVIGYLIPYISFPLVINSLSENLPAMYAAGIEKYHMFSLPMLLAAAAVVLITVYISLLKPMRMAAGISPVEAIRYTEAGGSKKTRRGRKSMSVSGLIFANLVRNKKRTAVTMITMGLSCVLFMSFAGIINSMSPEDIARREIDEGDFRIAMDYSMNDREYPENNLDVIQQTNPLNGGLIENILSIDGVENVETKSTVLISSDLDSSAFEDGQRKSMSYFKKENVSELERELNGGAIDYDNMVSENGVICANAQFMDEYDLHVGDIIPLTVHDGEKKIELTVRIDASLESIEGLFLLPEDAYNNLGLSSNTVTDLYIYADKDKYDSIKDALKNIELSDERFVLYSMDEEMRLGSASVSIVKYPMYIILIMIAVIGFMNLINTMITSIVTRKREIGVLQAIGLSNRQLYRMLTGEGLFFSAGTMLLSVTAGNIFGYLMFIAAKNSHFMSLSAYHYPFKETIILAAVLMIGQFLVSLVANRSIRRESMIDRIRNSD